MNKQATEDAFRAALRNACGEVNEAARLSTEIFEGDALKKVRRELGRLIENIEVLLLDHLNDQK